MCLACHRLQGTNWQATKFQLERRVAQLQQESEGEGRARKSMEADKQAAQVGGCRQCILFLNSKHLLLVNGLSIHLSIC
jgi:hypothetical protein